MIYRDYTGERFGLLTVIKLSHIDKDQKKRWLCRCDCGNETLVTTGGLSTGDAKSCGCARTKRKTKFYWKVRSAWNDMMRRCYDEKHSHYHSYGGRGITVAPEWHSLDRFYQDIGEPPAKEFSLDRIDNELGYSLLNCRWTDRKTQGRNTRRNVNITFRGETKCITAWAETLGINKFTLRSALRQGKTLEDIVTNPPKKKAPKTSCHPGIHYATRSNKWVVRRPDGSWIGQYLTEEAAYIAQQKALLVPASISDDPISCATGRQ